MSSGDLKHGIGTFCVIQDCYNFNYYDKTKSNEFNNISFYKFPTDLQRQRIWARLCKVDYKTCDLQTSYVCSVHFDSDSFICTMDSVFLGHTPKPVLKMDAIPTLNLQYKKNEIYKEIYNAAISEQVPVTLNYSLKLPLETASIYEDTNLKQEISSNVDYKELYNDLLKKFDKLQTENKRQEEELLIMHMHTNNYAKVNECLRMNMDIIQNRMDTITEYLEKSEEKMRSLNKNRLMGEEIQILVSKIFTSNQLSLILNKKKQVRWTNDELAKANTLKCYSKKAYMFIKNEFHYPLPGLSSLQQWVRIMNMRNSIIGNKLNKGTENNEDQ